LKAIVHIGTEKTGTSSIQMFLYKNRKKLIKSGYHFLQSAGKTSHWALPAYFSEDDRFNELYRDEGIRSRQQIDQFKQNFFEQFEKELRSLKKNIHTVIISSEHFHSRIRTKDEMKDVHQFLSGHFDDVKIICYLREQAATCASWYSTSMKSGGTLSFDEFFKRCKPGNYYFNYDEMLCNWERHFGIESLNVALFSRDRFLNGDLLDDFTARLDPALVGTLNKAIQSENESLKPVGQALARAVNILFPVTAERVEVGDLRKLCKDLISRSLFGKGQQPALDVQKSIYNSFLEINERVRQKYFPEMEALFAPPQAAGSAENVVDGRDFEVISSIFNVIGKHGKEEFITEGYAQVCTVIAACIDDVTKQREDAEEDVKEDVRRIVKEVVREVAKEHIKEVVKEVVKQHVKEHVREVVKEVVKQQVKRDVKEGSVAVMLDAEDARLLSRAAARLKSREPGSAFRLMTLASQVGPSLPGIRLKLNEYKKVVDQVPKRQYLITYTGSKTSLDEDELLQLKTRLKKWLDSLDILGDSALNTVEGSSTINSDSSVVGTAQSSLVGFTIIQADSMENAIAIARECPYLEFGATLEVSQFR
jgi:hypothetical protein